MISCDPMGIGMGSSPSLHANLTQKALWHEEYSSITIILYMLES
jgi:hypothetical protein